MRGKLRLTYVLRLWRCQAWKIWTVSNFSSNSELEEVKHLFGTGEIEALVEKTGSLQGALEGPFQCRQEGCNKVYVQHSRRVK